MSSYPVQTLSSVHLVFVWAVEDGIQTTLCNLSLMNRFEIRLRTWGKKTEVFLLYTHTNMLRSQHFASDFKFSIAASWGTTCNSTLCFFPMPRSNNANESGWETSFLSHAKKKISFDAHQYFYWNIGNIWQVLFVLKFYLHYQHATLLWQYGVECLF